MRLDDHREVHHAADKEQQHQGPAAPQAVPAVDEPQPERPGASRAPVLHQERGRRLAGAEAGALERRELVEPGDDEHGAGHDAVTAPPSSATARPRW